MVPPPFAFGSKLAILLTKLVATLQQGPHQNPAGRLRLIGALQDPLRSNSVGFHAQAPDLRKPHPNETEIVFRQSPERHVKGNSKSTYRGALEIFKARLGPEHPYTICCQERLDKHLSRLNQAATTIASSANPSGSGQPVTFTATVNAVPPGIGTPTGTVTFKVDGTPQSPVPLTVINGVDQATFTTASLSAGTYTITAVYGGDSNFTTSTSLPFCQKVK